VLVICNTECCRGHSDCDGNDGPGTRPLHYISFPFDQHALFQLRRARARSNEGYVSRFVLTRVVRVTVETNVLTGE